MNELMQLKDLTGYVEYNDPVLKGVSQSVLLGLCDAGFLKYDWALNGNRMYILTMKGLLAIFGS